MKYYKPANFYLFFNNKVSNVLLMLLPIVFIWLNMILNENNLLGKIAFWLVIASLFFVIKPLISYVKKRKEIYILTDEALVYHHPVLIGDNINSYSFGKMNVELKNNIITHTLTVDDFTTEDNEVILYMRSKKECLELFKKLQTNNAQSHH